MSSRFPHPGSDESAETAHDVRQVSSEASVRITVTVANRYMFETRVVTGRQIKQTAGIPAGFALFRRTLDGNEPIADDEQVELRSGDHFFARPSSSAS
jgi:Multiubiquitin